MNCAPEVRGLLMKTDGVTGAEVSFDERSAVVTVKEGTDPETIAAAVDGQFSAVVRK